MIKCILWDLDNTLWKGVYSEEKVKLNNEYVSLIRKLNSLGIISSIISRNDEKILQRYLIELGIDELFILPKINWERKSNNIKKLSKELNIKPKDMLFIDDSPFERDEVLSSIDDINVVEPSSIDEIYNLIGLKNDKFSTESYKRFHMYKTEENRLKIKEKKQLTNLEFLQQCNIKIKLRKATIEDFDRMEELFNRTSQLNTTGIKYTDIEIKRFINDSKYNCLVGEVWDKYGSYGISSVIIYYESEYSINILHLVVSCRLMGKRIPDVLLMHLKNEAINNNRQDITIKFVRNKFNRQMLFFINKNHFQKIEEDTYGLNFRNFKNIENVEWIQMEGIDNE